ncbi:MAG: hypothetical protein AAFX95_26630 [Cyanobacteria bacterium J06639_16]
MPRVLCVFLGLVALSLVGVNACQQPETSDQTARPAARDTLASSPPTAEADPVEPSFETAITGCQTALEKELGKQINITSSTLMEDGTFLLLWQVSETDYGSCKVDSEGNVVTITTIN